MHQALDHASFCECGILQNDGKRHLIMCSAHLFTSVIFSIPK